MNTMEISKEKPGLVVEDRPGLVVYVAGPYGDEKPEHVRKANLEMAVETGREVMKRGHVPVIPHLNIASLTHKNRKLGLACSMAVMMKCDVVLRIPGLSEGADEEVRRARKMGKTVIISTLELPRFSEGEMVMVINGGERC